MVFHDEPGGHQAGQVLGAAVEVEHTAALAAGEVVVVVLTGQLVPMGFAWDFHGDEPAFFGETTDGAIDRCNAQIWDEAARAFQDFVRTQGPGGLPKNLSNGAALSGVALHIQFLLDNGYR